MTYHRLTSKPKSILEGKRASQCIVDEWTPGPKRPNVKVQTHVQRPWALLICIAWTIALSVWGMWTVFTVVTERL